MPAGRASVVSGYVGYRNVVGAAAEAEAKSKTEHTASGVGEGRYSNRQEAPTSRSGRRKRPIRSSAVCLVVETQSKRTVWIT